MQDRADVDIGGGVTLSSLRKLAWRLVGRGQFDIDDIVQEAASRIVATLRKNPGATIAPSFYIRNAARTFANTKPGTERVHASDYSTKAHVVSGNQLVGEFDGSQVELFDITSPTPSFDSNVALRVSLQDAIDAAMVRIDEIERQQSRAAGRTSNAKIYRAILDEVIVNESVSYEELVERFGVPLTTIHNAAYFVRQLVRTELARLLSDETDATADLDDQRTA